MLMQLIPFAIIAGLLLLAFAVGGARERAHLRALDRREAEAAHMRLVNLREISQPESVLETQLVVGSVVIATDYFKTFIAGFRMLIGGEMRVYESLAQRARREAVLRMVEEARAAGATEVWNIRLDTANIGGLVRNRAVMCEAYAYGTAVRRGEATIRSS